MKSFNEIIGQNHIIECLRNAIQMRTVSHAYLIEGEAGSGKKSIAKLFAMTLLCEESDVEPCLNCHSCRQALSDNHPDLCIITHEKPELISVNEIRKQLVDDVGIKPYHSDYKIYIIPDAEKMNANAQNALLKTLEEPPSYTVILLLAANATRLLETIRSRSVPLLLRPLKDREVKEYLMRQQQIPDYRASEVAAFARGNVGRAEMLLKNESFQALRAEAELLFQEAERMNAAEISKAAKRIGEMKTDLTEFFDYLMLRYRDVCIYKATGETGRLLFQNEVRLTAERARKCSYEGMDAVFCCIKKTKDRIRSHAATEIALEMLILTLKEN